MANKNFGSYENFDYDDAEPEEAFMAGFEQDIDPEECAECGSAMREETLSKTISGEALNFCSKECIKDYKESM